MNFSEVVSLVTIAEAQTSLTAAITAGTKTTAYAEKKSVRQSEFYQSAALGLNPEAVFLVRKHDYANQSALIHSSVNYKIIRTFEKPNELIELVCERVG